jgi:hypothetical protein
MLPPEVLNNGPKSAYNSTPNQDPVNCVFAAALPEGIVKPFQDVVAEPPPMTRWPPLVDIAGLAPAIIWTIPALAESVSAQRITSILEFVASSALEALKYILLDARMVNVRAEGALTLTSACIRIDPSLPSIEVFEVY